MEIEAASFTTLYDAFQKYRESELTDFALEHMGVDGAVSRFTLKETVGLIESNAADMQALGVIAGDRVILAPDLGSAFFVGFWACQLIGAVAVPWKRSEGTSVDARNAVQLFVSLCQPKLTLVEKEVSEFELAGISTMVLKLDQIHGCYFVKPDKAPVSTEDLAILQFTSGSTSNPKGCMLSHRAVLANAMQIYERAAGKIGETCVHWVPLHHDMGLMGAVLAPVILQQRTIIIEPRCFMTKPLCWINMLADRGPVHTSVSNFALAMVLKRANRLKLKSDSLSEVKNIICGAEPIDASLVRAFCNALEPFGLRPDAIHPAYGMAEATLMMTSRKAGLYTQSLRSGMRDQQTDTQIPENEKEYVSVGIPLKGIELRILNDKNCEVLAGEVGEIVVSAPSIMNGYWENPEATAQRLRNGWLFTGDLGAVMDGELYITGRISDVIIIRGRNFYPHDIERAVAEAVELDPHRVCAFSVPDGAAEKAVILIEARGMKPRAQLATEARKICQQNFGISTEIIMCAGHAIPRTTSGKPRRSRLTADYLDQKFGEVEFPINEIVSINEATIGKAAAKEINTLIS
jgi:acyl-CoA synthetase (AMP-forming)/AMP-acid ligase II